MFFSNLLLGIQSMSSKSSIPGIRLGFLLYSALDFSLMYKYCSSGEVHF